jgi:hypothetical protein
MRWMAVLSEHTMRLMMSIIHSHIWDQQRPIVCRMVYCCCLEAPFFPEPGHCGETVHGARTGRMLRIHYMEGLSRAERATARIRQRHDLIEEPEGQGYAISGRSFEEHELLSESLTSTAH